MIFQSSSSHPGGRERLDSSEDLPEAGLGLVEEPAVGEGVRVEADIAASWASRWKRAGRSASLFAVESDWEAKVRPLRNGGR